MVYPNIQKLWYIQNYGISNKIMVYPKLCTHGEMDKMLCLIRKCHNNMLEVQYNSMNIKLHINSYFFLLPPTHTHTHAQLKGDSSKY